MRASRKMSRDSPDGGLGGAEIADARGILQDGGVAVGFARASQGVGSRSRAEQWPFSRLRDKRLPRFLIQRPTNRTPHAVDATWGGCNPPTSRKISAKWGRGTATSASRNAT